MIRISLAERGAQIRRKLDAGFVMPAVENLRNSDLRRLPEKVELLERLRVEAERQQRSPPFAARF